MTVPEKRILIVEDVPADAELAEYTLRSAGIDFCSKVVETEQEYRDALKQFSPDIIISDYDLPQFNGAMAQKIAREICPDLPFILFTGAMGEERAIEILTGGATDYVMKNRISRLVPAVERAWKEKEERKKRSEAETERDMLLQQLESRVRERTARLQEEIAERKRAQDALAQREERVRAKLDSILSPAGDVGKLDLGDIIDVPSIQSFMDDFYSLAHIPMSIIDLKGNVLVGVGWQEICTKFHRVNPATGRHCVESDTILSAGIRPGECRLYKCRNNMWDIATPLMIGDRQFGNIFSGQFFFEDEPLDYELFRSQARQYGFDEEVYIKALEAVPQLSRQTLDTAMSLFIKFAGMISKLSYGNIRLAQALVQRDALTASLKESREDLNRAQAVAKTGSWRLNINRNELHWSDETYRIFGIPQGRPMTYEHFLACVHPEDTEYVEQKWTAALRGNPYDIEHRILAGGDTRWVRQRAEFDFNSSGAPASGFGTIQDITEYRQAEERILQTSREWEDTFNSISDPISIHDREFRVVRANRAFSEKLGEQAFIGKKCHELVHGSPEPHEMCPQRQSIENKMPVSREFWEPRLGKYLLVTCAPIFDSGNQVSGTVHLIKDKTERSRAD